jgi:2-polyprenyl-6-methoxyphenol hydroxylase-like FAD-dependent oxidoreductase
LNTLDIAVIGAGPAGLACALYMKRAGHRPVIFERFESVAPVGSGLMLQPTGLTVLHDLGLLPSILGLGHLIHRLIGVDAKTKRPVLDVRYDALARGRFGLAVNRAALFDVLFLAAFENGIEVRNGQAVEAVGAGSGGVTIFGESGGALGRFDLAVDASGARSKLRRFAKFPSEPRPLAYGALWAMLDWHGGTFEAHALTQRYDKASVMIGVLPTGKLAQNGREKAAFFWSVKPTDFAGVKAMGLQAWNERVRGYWPECSVYLDQIESFEDMTLAHYGHHTLRVPAGERIAFVGDSAHSTSPQLGQGANMALLDARALAHALETTSDVAAALEAYSKARRAHVRVFQGLSRMFTPFYQSDSAALAFVRDRLVSTLARIPPAPKILASMVSGTLVDPFAKIGLAECDWTKP